MNLNPRTTACCLLLTTHCVLFCAAPARAQMPLHPPEIRTIFPIGGVQGSTVEVLVDGQNVSDPAAVAISGEGVRAIVIAAGVAPERVVSIAAGIDSERFHGGVSGKPVRDEFGLGDAPLVGLVANVRGSKGHSVFLEAARTVVAAVPDIRFLIVGDGVGFDEVRGRVRRMGLDARVTLTGFRRDIPEVMAALDVLVLPSIRSEAIPQVIPQALAVGTPVVASTIGGSPELIRDGENGRLVPPADPHALADAILALLREPERARAMARAGQAMVQSQYTIDVTMARTIAVYRDLLDASRTRELNI